MNPLMCCGITELYGLQDHYTNRKYSPKKFLIDSCNDNYYGTGAAYFVFSTASTATRGEALVKYIRDNKLGTVKVFGKPARNPNSGKIITAWVWRVDQKAWEKWIEANVPKEEFDDVYNPW